MKCYLLDRDFGCKTASGVNWSLERDGPFYSSQDGHWQPSEDTYYEHGDNTWFASGKVSEDSKGKMSQLWVQVVNAKESFNNTHVIGDYTTAVKEEVIVDQAFVDVMTALEPGLFDFWPHKKVWDINHNCQPWNGPFYFATLLPTIESFSPNVTEMFYRETVQEKYQGSYSLGKHPPTIKASSIAGNLIWRDRLTRKVLCTQPFLDVLSQLGVHEWKAYEVKVLDDRH
ncbi:hypothetical protein ROA7450_00371 [Roseovarius albus]|uniref:Uncharacterized protein n=1 Tax=Roseovarius albus TaxID=1247867 RepID=A0A1X6YBJ8_9RHOB|nr:hypothetical protein [Roseovarius albus]SLN15690.1 hypothetical protein ROA7450_00371 [Roseovarius albus]